jgi:hypothetical protein
MGFWKKDKGLLVKCSGTGPVEIGNSSTFEKNSQF